MSWNYRVVRFTDTEEYYEIKEVFYDTDNRPIGYSDAVCGSDTYEGLFKCASMMQSAHAKPVLNAEEIGVRTQDPLCKICGKELDATKECAWTGCPLNWGDEASERRQDIIGQNGPTGDHY